MSDYFKGERVSWRNQTRPDQLFLSSAAHLNSEQIKPIFHSLINRIPIIRTDRISNEMAKRQCKKSEKDKKIMIQLLRSAGIELDDIIFEKPKVNFEELSDDMPNVIKEEILKDLQQRFIAQHETFFVYLDNENKPQK